MLLITIVMQLLSGFFLGWYYIPEPGLVVELREEMFNDTRFGAEVFYMHVRGVDSIFVLSYMHILKKIYLKNYVTSESDGWILGGYAFFLIPLYCRPWNLTQRYPFKRPYFNNYG